MFRGKLLVGYVFSICFMSLKDMFLIDVRVQILTVFSTWSFDLSVRTLMANITLIKLEQQN